MREHGKISGVKRTRKAWGKVARRSGRRRSAAVLGGFPVMGLSVLLCGFPVRAAVQAPQGEPAAAADVSGLPDAPRA